MTGNTSGPKSDDQSHTSESVRSTDEVRPSTRRRVRVKATRSRHKIAIGLGISALVVTAFGAILGYTALEAKSDLESAKDHALAAKDALLDGDTETAEQAAADANRYSSAAYAKTRSPQWRIASAVPFLGSPFRTTEEMADVASGLTHDVLGPAVKAGTSLAPSTLIQPNGKIALTPLRSAAPLLAETATAAQALAAQAQEISTSEYIAAVNDARTQLQAQTSELANLLDNTAVAAHIAPALLGADGPRSYFMGFQTNAEARGTGGLLGGYGIIRVEDGAARVNTLNSNSALSLDNRPIDLGPDFNALYGQSRPTTDLRNSNLSAHFPHAAQIWQSLWAQESGGEVVNGAIATDPIALSYILKALGPITMPDGEVVSADNVVELTESTAYVRFAEDNAARKQYLQEIAARVVSKMTGQIRSPASLLDALGRAASEGRIAVWSAQADEQSVLAGTPLGHTVPDDAAPYAGVVVNNQAGNKLDYYLSREIDYTAGSCTDGTRASTVTIRLTNNAPEGDLPNYVDGMVDNRINAREGTNVAALTLLATRGAKLDKVSVDGRMTFAASGKEQGHPAYMIRAAIPRGATSVVEFKLTEPSSDGTARVPVQPLVDDPKITVNVPTC
ncbi:hypothetical protein B2J88_29345 [Rhodococcus sp. SRB_17]|uniref:DUF4012 domain-containing protein n=1 Tax=Rhodococcus sp. OK302 TaxID=1882769 RepID=UPI000B93FCF8|nr:DUF4012 domain-containing protein [Rhodococcus sp. OK302]NMM88409.1 hypothetical protein [Rhodococcus sp. SRB_17]OYD71833.1 uncharacterized protein DUF4012 [Rhodococcus sp. OK302]